VKLIGGEPLRELREIDLVKQCGGRGVLSSKPVAGSSY
jgi:hypothetical protein